MAWFKTVIGHNFQETTFDVFVQTKITKGLLYIQFCNNLANIAKLFYYSYIAIRPPSELLEQSATMQPNRTDKKSTSTSGGNECLGKNSYLIYIFT